MNIFDSHGLRKFITISATEEIPKSELIKILSKIVEERVETTYNIIERTHGMKQLALIAILAMASFAQDADRLPEVVSPKVTVSNDSTWAPVVREMKITAPEFKAAQIDLGWMPIKTKTPEDVAGIWMAR